MIAHIATTASLLPVKYALFAAKKESNDKNEVGLIFLYVIHCMMAKTVTDLCLGERLDAGTGCSQRTVGMDMRNLVDFRSSLSCLEYTTSGQITGL
jgi:hypothetical protein